jgi:hypothetical protein
VQLALELMSSLQSIPCYLSSLRTARALHAYAWFGTSAGRPNRRLPSPPSGNQASSVPHPHTITHTATPAVPHTAARGLVLTTRSSCASSRWRVSRACCARSSGSRTHRFILVALNSGQRMMGGCMVCGVRPRIPAPQRMGCACTRCASTNQGRGGGRKLRTVPAGGAAADGPAANCDRACACAHASAATEVAGGQNAAGPGAGRPETWRTGHAVRYSDDRSLKSQKDPVSPSRSYRTDHADARWYVCVQKVATASQPAALSSRYDGQGMHACTRW